MQLPLCYYGNPVLRKRAQEIVDFAEVREFANDLIETMMLNPAAGLAAPQVGKSIRMFVRRNFIEKEDGMIEYTDAKVYINPRITILSDDLDEDEEGCLSIPKLRLPVIRPVHIRVEAFDLEGKSFTEELEGYGARLVMHENDHINGVLYIDRIDPKLRKRIDSDLRALKKKYQ